LKPVDFAYLRPTSTAQALTALSECDDAKIIAGGQSLGPLLNMRLVRPSLIVDINAVAELQAIDATDDAIRIGATVRQRTIERSNLIAQRLPLLHAAIPHVGHSHIRNRGTLVGSIVHADPTAELPLIALCLDATIEIAGPDGVRDVPAADFFFGYLTTAIAAGEIAIAVRFPSPALPAGVRRGCAFREMARRHGDFAIVGAAAQIDFDIAHDRVHDVRLGLIGVGGTPFRFHDGEALIRAMTDPRATFAAVAQAAGKAIDPDSDLHATAAYRRTVATTLLHRVLDAAWIDAHLPDRIA
jgi:carbon-monoxide dehydrogenase medium subunit